MWSEVALNNAFGDVLFHSCPLNGRWIEIDNHEDLEIAQRIFSELVESV